METNQHTLLWGQGKVKIIQQTSQWGRESWRVTTTLQLAPLQIFMISARPFTRLELAKAQTCIQLQLPKKILAESHNFLAFFPFISLLFLHTNGLLWGSFRYLDKMTLKNAKCYLCQMLCKNYFLTMILLSQIHQPDNIAFPLRKCS